MKKQLQDPDISRYRCPKCDQNITLYGGKTSSTSVICEKCGVWMQIDNVHGLPKLINIRGDAGDKAFDCTRREFNSSFVDEQKEA
jgi:hypothetical protein